MADENKTVNKQKIDINTYRFPSGQTIDEILKTQTNWSTDEQCLLNMIDSDWRAVDDFITDKEKELLKLFFGFYEKKYTQKEIASIYGVNQSHISRTITKICYKLKEVALSNCPEIKNDFEI